MLSPQITKIWRQLPLPDADLSDEIAAAMRAARAPHASLLDCLWGLPCSPARGFPQHTGTRLRSIDHDEYAESGMIESRSSYVRTGGLPNPIPVAAACTDRRQAPQARRSPPALAHRPAGPSHYAIPPTTNEGEDRTEIPFLAIGNMANRPRHIATKTWRNTAKPQLLATISPQLALSRRGRLSQNVAEFTNTSAFDHNSERRAA